MRKQETCIDKCVRVCVGLFKPTQHCSSSSQRGGTQAKQIDGETETLVSHVSVTLPQDYKRRPATDLAEVHPVAVFDPRLEMSLITLRLCENVCEC